MGWFTRQTNPVTHRTQELSSEIDKLKEQIIALQDASHSENPAFIRKTLEKTDPVSIELNLKKDANKPKRDCPSLYNQQGVRKFDLHGWWQRIKTKEPLPEPNPNEKLVTYLATGRSNGYTALRKETRIARNRFILLTIVLIGVLWSILSLLIPQL